MIKKILAFLLMSAACSVSADQITFAWDPVTGDANVAGYELHWGIESGAYNSFEDIDGVATEEYTITITEPGTYYFAIRSRNTDGSLVSAFSNEVSTDVTADSMLVPSGFRKYIQISVN